MTCVVASLAVVIPAFDAPAGAAVPTWSQPVTVSVTTATCGTFQSTPLPVTTTQITSLAVAGGGAGSAASAGNGTGGAGGFGGKITASPVTVPSTVPAFLNAQVGCGGGGGGHGAGSSGTSAGGAGGTGSAPWAAGGVGGSAIDSVSGFRDGGGGGGAASALCFGSLATTNCGAGSTPIAIASGGGGGGASGANGSSHDSGGGGGSGGGSAGVGNTTGIAGTASTGTAGQELYIAGGAAGQGSGGGGGGGGQDAAAGGGGGGTGGNGAVGNDGSNTGTKGNGGTNNANGVGGPGTAGVAAFTCSTLASAGGSTLAGSGGAGGIGASFSSTNSGDFINGGGGGGGGYTGGGGGACDDFHSDHSSTATAAAGGGGGAQWVNNTFVTGPTFANANTTLNGAATGAASCTASAGNAGAGGTGVTSAAAGDAGCPGAITFTLTGNAVSITAPAPTVTAGSASVNIPVTYNAGSPFSGFAISSWAVSCAAGGTLTATGSGLGANQTATITGTAPTTAGSTACTLTANSGDGTNGAAAYQNQVAFTLVVNAAAASKLAFTPATPGPGTAGSAIPSTAVSVEDQFNNVVTSQNTGSIAMTIASGPQASFTSGTTTVNVASGVASFASLVVNKAGSYTFTATPASISGVTVAVNSSSVTVNPAAENKLVVTAQPSSPIAAGGNVSVGVTIQDTFGNTITTGNTGSTDTLAVALSSGSFAAGTTSVAAVNGVASFSGLQINSTAGSPYTINVTDTTHGTVTGAATNQVVVNAGAANKLAFVQQPSTVAAGANMAPAPSVQVQDAAGNAVPGAGVSITLAPSSGTIFAGATASTNAAGLATFNGLQINTAATGLTLTGSSSPLTSTPVSSTFNVTGGAASSVSFVTGPSNVVAGVNMSPAVVVQVQDQFGNAVNAAGVTLGVSSGSLSSGFSGSTGTNGQVSFGSLKINTAATGLTLTATTGVINSAASAPFNVTAAAASKLGFVQQPSIVTAGVAMTPPVTVQVQDQFGNPVASNNLLITLAPSSGLINSGNAATTISSGLATFSGITINAVATLTLTASAPGPLTSPASTSFAVIAAAANKLGFAGQPPASVTAGASISPAVTVQVQDQFGNAVSSNNVSITLAPSAGAIASGATAATNASGLASFSVIKINTAATGLTLSASSTSPVLASGPSTSFNVTAATQSKLVFLQGPSNVVAGATMSAVTVQAQDPFGNPVSTGGTTITLVPSSGTINNGNQASTVGGVATFSAIKINIAATGLTFTATGPSLTAAPASSAFDVTAAGANKLAFAQQPTSVVAGVAMSPAVTVQVQDTFGNSVSSAGVSITLTPSAGTINAGNSTTTSAAGLATFGGITINAAATGVTLTASGGSLTATPASNAFNITAAAANKLVFVQGPNDTTLGIAIAPAVTVQVQDQFGNSVSGAGVNITLTPSTGTIASGGSVNTAATGLATFGAITINTAATGITLTASAAGPLTSLASASFNVSVLVANGAALTNTATDAGSGVDTVSYFSCIGFTGTCTNANWAPIGSSNTSVGNYPVTWSAQPPNGSYRLVSVGVDHVTNTSSSSASIPVTVFNQVSQTISFTSTPPASPVAGGTYTPTATASSGLSVTFTIDASSTSVCSIASGLVTFNTGGTCVVDANQAGNATFQAALQVQQSIAVSAVVPLGSGTHTVTVPAHVTSVIFTIFGGGGADGPSGGNGGNGGSLTGVVNLPDSASATTFTVIVGAGGLTSGAAGASGANCAPGGAGGTTNNGGGGGGATCIYVSSAPTFPIAIAGGGGGSGNNGSSTGAGGNGSGGSTANPGSNAGVDGAGAAAVFGTATTGGKGGSTTTSGSRPFPFSNVGGAAGTGGNQAGQPGGINGAAGGSGGAGGALSGAGGGGGGGYGSGGGGAGANGIVAGGAGGGGGSGYTGGTATITITGIALAVGSAGTHGGGATGGGANGGNGFATFTGFGITGS